MSYYNISIKRENLDDCNHLISKVKKEPKWETVDIKPNIAKIKQEPQCEFSGSGTKSVKVDVKAEIVEPRIEKKSRTLKVKKKKVTKRKRRQTKRKSTTKTKKRKKPRTKRKRQPNSAEQKGIRNARLQLMQRIGIDRNSIPTSVSSKRRSKTVNEAKINAGIDHVSINGSGLDIGSFSEGTAEVISNSFQENVTLNNLNQQWFLQSTASSSPDVLSSIIQKQSQFLSKKRNYEIERNGRVNYIGKDTTTKPSVNVEMASDATDDQLADTYVDKKPDIKTLKLKKMEYKHNNTSEISVKEEHCALSYTTDATNNVYNSRIVKTESTESMLSNCQNCDVEIIEVKKEKPEIPVILLDSPMIEDVKSDEDKLWFSRVKLEVKSLLKPFLRNSEITEDEYTEILKRSVPKVCKYSNNLNLIKLNQLILEYIKKMKRARNNLCAHK